MLIPPSFYAVIVISTCYIKERSISSEKAELPEAFTEALCIKRAQESGHLRASQNSYIAI